MTITVKFFANLREQYGLTEEIIDFNDGISISDIWLKVTDGQEIPQSVMIAVNMQYAKDNIEVKDGDEVAFFPPVSGG